MTLSLIFSAASLIICGFSFIYFLAYLRRRTGAERLLKDFKEEVDLLIDGIDLKTDQNLTLLEDKAKSVKALIDTLDRRIAVYARELDRRNTQESALSALAGESPTPRPSEGAHTNGTNGVQTEGAYAALGRARGLRSSLEVILPEPDTTSETPGQETAAARETSLQVARETSLQVARETSLQVAPADPAIDSSGGSLDPAVPEAETGQSAGPRFIRSPNQVKPKTPLTELVLELSRNGFSAETIAARLGVTIAEVDLALAMSERKFNR
ncbi:hypothetical protein [Treponema primitia]|uniref:hypothetical protein n=1 Tax=Treponema primitia TaxID=88058 RepID=UPI00025558F6|nr:hypothetical protein [Treponema primitia]